MKKLFLLPFLLFTFVLQAYSFEWTDEYGVTWSVGSSSTWDSSSQSYHYDYCITGVSNYGKDVLVPDTVYENVNGILFPRIVTRIDQYAFGNKEIDGITLPKTITTISNNAFTIPHSYYYYEYKGCTLKKINLDNVISIGYSAFCNCKYLEEIGTPSFVTSINDYAFCGCSVRESIITN